jgi:hypothetical protein
VVVEFGTADDVYPANNADLVTLVANAIEYPFTFENKSNGPASNPAVVNVINTIIFYFIYF